MNISLTSLLGEKSSKKPQLNKTTLEQLIFVSAFFQLVGETLGNPHLMHLKPIPVILMILLSRYSLSTDANITKGLIFGLIGDLCLMFPTTLLFQLGAVSFLIGHLCYIRAFIQASNPQAKSYRSLAFLPHLGSILIFSALLINSFLLWKYLPNKALFVLYGIVLSSMAASSFYRQKQTNNKKYWMGIAGAIVFMTSDYLIAYSKFMGCQNQLTGLGIMMLYYAGQFLILKGNSQQREKGEQ